MSRAHATKVKNAAISYPEGAIFGYRAGTLPDFLETLLQLAHPRARIERGDAFHAVALGADVVAAGVIGNQRHALLAVDGIVHLTELEHAGQTLGQRQQLGVGGLRGGGIVQQHQYLHVAAGGGEAAQRGQEVGVVEQPAFKVEAADPQAAPCVRGDAGGGLDGRRMVGDADRFAAGVAVHASSSSCSSR